jgi:ATP-binding cassette subfamily B (MDR/TAP) protein 1
MTMFGSADALPTTKTTPDASISHLLGASSAHLSPDESPTSTPHESDVYSPPNPSVKLLFSLLPRRDLYLVVLPAFLLSMIAGVLAPFMTLVLSNVVNVFAKFCRLKSPSSSDRANLKYDIAISSLELVFLAAVSLGLSSLTSFLWILTGERNSLTVRQKVYASVSSRQMAWFDAKMGGEGGTSTNADGSSGAGGLMTTFARWVVSRSMDAFLTRDWV